MGPNQLKNRGVNDFQYIDLVTAFFVTTLLLSNLLSSAKLVDTHLNLFGMELIFDGGLIIFPVCYIFSDILTEVYGYGRSRRVIWLGFSSSLLLSFAVKILGMLPGEANWSSAQGQQSYDMILGGLSSGGIILASMAAYLVGEFLNSYVLAKMKIFQKGKKMSLRFVSSTMVGQMVDTFLFFTIACFLGVFPWSVWLSLFLTNYFIKVGIEILFLPLSCRTANFLKKREHEDHYDRKTNFNPFFFQA